MIAAIMCLALVGAELNTGEPRLEIPAAGSPVIVGLAVSMGDKQADQAWSEFLDHWLAYFDSNRDGQISLSESEAVPALPNSSGAMVRLDVRAADKNDDACADREEFKRFYQDRGLCAVNVAAPIADRAALQTAETLWNLLDRDRDGKLSVSELALTQDLLNRWDRNEDECLSPLELASTVTVERAPDVAVRWVSGESIPESAVTIPVRLNSLQQPQPVESKLEHDVVAGLELLSSQRLRMRLPSTTLVVHPVEASVHRITAAEQYLLGEINSVRGESSGLDFARIRQEPTLDWLAPLMDAADNDRNQQLGEVEIKTLIGLLAEGASAQVSMTVSVRGRNLFDLLDADGDNQLDLRELLAARRLITVHDGNSSAEKIAREDVPLSLLIGIGRGPAGGRFARLRMARRPTEASPRRSPKVDPPRWFAAMDRNRDQFLSRSEFMGSPRQFDELDRNSDGIISSGEIVDPLNK